MFYPLPHVYLPRPCFLPITTCLFTKTMFFYPLPHVYLTLACLTHYHMFIYHDHVFYPLSHVYLPRPCFLPITTCLFTMTMFFTHYHMFIYHDHVFLPITTCLFTTTMFFYPLLHVYLPRLCLFYSFFQLTIMFYPSSISCFILYPIFVFDARLYYTSNCPTIQINL